MGWLRSQIERLTGTRRFAAGALAIYIVGWLAERALTLFWEKSLERQAPVALRQVSNLLATDLATGMALMALLALFVPPVAQWIFESSAKFSRLIELQSKRLSKRDYLAEISREAIALAQEARAITLIGRFSRGRAPFEGLSPQEAWLAREKFYNEEVARQMQLVQTFAVANEGRIKFLMGEFFAYGFAKDAPDRLYRITSDHCLVDLADALEEAAHRIRASLARDGYPMTEPEKPILPEGENAG